MTESSYWLYHWIDNCGVTSVKSAKARLSDDVSRQALLDLAAAELDVTATLPDEPVPSITAGRGVDLSGELDCLGWECRRDRVDDLLTHVCLYFDRVVVVVASAHDTLHAHERLPALRFREVMLSHIHLLLHLRAIGADQLLFFRQKPPACEVHWKDGISESELRKVVARASDEIERLDRQAVISLKPHKDHLDFEFSHPEFEHIVWGAVKKRRKVPPRRAVCDSVFRRYFTRLTSDVMAAQKLGTALGSTIQYHGHLLRTSGRRAGALDVAFALGLPVLHGMDPKMVLKLRLDEQDVFHRFRRNLGRALNERLRSVSKAPSELVAKEIEQDLIVPAILGIEGRLRKARTVLAKKASLNLTLGALATACGLITGDPALKAAGLAGAFGALTAMHKYRDEEHEVGLDDMYFLWLAKHRHGG